MPEQPSPQRETISWEQALQHKQGGDAGVPATAGVAEGTPAEEPTVDTEVGTPEPVLQAERTEIVGTPEVATTEMLHETLEEEVATQIPSPALDTLPEGDTQPASAVTAENDTVPDAATEIQAAVDNPSEENLVALSQAAHH